MPSWNKTEKICIAVIHALKIVKDRKTKTLWPIMMCFILINILNFLSHSFFVTLSLHKRNHFQRWLVKNRKYCTFSPTVHQSMKKINLKLSLKLKNKSTCFPFLWLFLSSIDPKMYDLHHWQDLLMPWQRAKTWNPMSSQSLGLCFSPSLLCT